MIKNMCQMMIFFTRVFYKKVYFERKNQLNHLQKSYY